MAFMVSQSWGEAFSYKMWTLRDGGLWIDVLKAGEILRGAWKIEAIAAADDIYKYRFPSSFCVPQDTWDLEGFRMCSLFDGSYLGLSADGTLNATRDADAAATFLKTDGLPPRSYAHCSLFLLTGPGKVEPIGWSGSRVRVGALMMPIPGAWTWFTTTFFECNCT